MKGVVAWFGSPWPPIVAAVVATCLLVYGAAGLRGSDQYWYIADVHRILQNEPPVTNNYFPGAILRQQGVPADNYIMHNNPFLYMAAAVSTPGNEYPAWIALNLLCHLFVAAAIYLTGRRFTAPPLAGLVTVLYLVSPIALWQATNPLLEMYFAALVAVSLALYFHRERIVAYLVLFPLLVLGVLSHPLFIPPAFAWALVALVEAVKPVRTMRVAGVVAYLAVLVYVMGRSSTWFPSSFQPDLLSIIASAVPGDSNMYWHFADTLPEVTPRFLLDKAAYSLKRHLLEPRFVPHFLFTNLAIAAGMYLLVTRWRRLLPVLLPLGLYLGLYLGLIFLQQNSPRYQQIVAGASFVVIAMWLQSLSDHRPERLRGILQAGVVLAVVLLPINLYAMYSTRQESLFERDQLDALTPLVESIAPDERVVAIDVKPHNPVSYLLRPREVLFIRTRLLSDTAIARAIELFDPDVYIVKDQNYPMTGEPVMRSSDTMFGELNVYRVDRRQDDVPDDVSGG